jgi:formylglycine-generating enzyme required for sulfatase activity
MHGNVWEWCLDHWHSNYVDAPENGSAWIDAIENLDRIQRGGSWRTELQLCRSAYRWSDHAESKSDNTGFRVVRPL